MVLECFEGYNYFCTEFGKMVECLNSTLSKGDRMSYLDHVRLVVGS